MGDKKLQLKGAVAVLIGAGRKNGVGAATARLLAQHGCHIALNTLKSKEQASSIIADCRSMGVEAELVLGDATQKKFCQEMASFVQKRWGRAKILVNSLGVTKSASYDQLDQLDADDFQKLFAVNVTAPYLMAQSFQKLLHESGEGVIINVSSAAGLTGKGSSIAYAVAKGAENTLTLALARALAPAIRVNAICPSFIDSSWWEESFYGREESYQALLAKMREGNLLGRVLKPEDVALAIMASIQSPVTTGELLRLDGGSHLGPQMIKSNKQHNTAKKHLSR